MYIVFGSVALCFSLILNESIVLCDDHIRIRCELYQNNIARYLIEGTRSGMTITANTLTNEITRKHRNEKAWYEAEVECWVEDILKHVERRS